MRREVTATSTIWSSGASSPTRWITRTPWLGRSAKVSSIMASMDCSVMPGSAPLHRGDGVAVVAVAHRAHEAAHLRPRARPGRARRQLGGDIETLGLDGNASRGQALQNGGIARTLTPRPPWPCRPSPPPTTRSTPSPRNTHHVVFEFQTFVPYALIDLAELRAGGRCSPARRPPPGRRQDGPARDLRAKSTSSASSARSCPTYLTTVPGYTPILTCSK